MVCMCMCSFGLHSLWLLHLHSCDFAMCNFGKAVRPLALASILMSLLQLYTLYVQSLTNIWALTYGGPYKWVASQEAVLDMEGLADYVDALAADCRIADCGIADCNRGWANVELPRTPGPTST